MIDEELLNTMIERIDFQMEKWGPQCMHAESAPILIELINLAREALASRRSAMSSGDSE